MSREIEEVLCQSHTVRQLIDLLESCDPEARILFTCNYGDYHKTQQALPITELTEHESNVLHESGYSQSGLAFNDPDAEPDEDEEPEDEDQETCPVVILHSD